MNSKLIEAAERMAAKAGDEPNGHNAAQFAQGALALVQAATSLHYAEAQSLPTEPEGGTD